MLAIYCVDGHYIEHVSRRGNNAKFCDECGKEAVMMCPKCNHGIPSETPPPKFCKQCGNKFPWTK